MTTKTPWFKPKSYGYGAVPCTWQGWLCVAAFAVAIGFAAIIFVKALFSLLSLIVFLAAITGAVAILIGIARAKSSAPWRWRSGGDR